LLAYPGFSFLEPWAEISERLRRLSDFQTDALLFKLMHYRTEVRDSVLEAPVVEHVGNLITRLDLDFLAELGSELQLTTLRVQEWLIV